MSNPKKQFSELLSSPLGELIASIGRGVGEAQAALDEGSLTQTLELYKLEEAQQLKDRLDNANEDEKQEIIEESRLAQLIRSIGYQPTFYAIPETEVEAKVSLNMNSQSRKTSIGQNRYKLTRYQANVTPLNANNINQYNLNANAAATLKFKIVPVPPPSGVPEKRIMPNLIGREYNDETIAIIESIGLNYKLDDASEVLLKDNPNNKLNIEGQNIAENEIIDLDTEIILTLKLSN